jgi:CDP-diacylglycerol---glycerol-3-phosphate 3-phosphatidyltransferase
MFTLPNFITLLRFPLALVFLQDNPFYRAIAILMAMLSDGLDGYIARRYGKISRVGTFIDPLADKIFVLFALGALLNENRLFFWEAAAMLCRDFSVVLFGIYLGLKGTLSQYQFRAIFCGKVMTALQFFVLFGLIFQVHFPAGVFILFIGIGLAALVELYLSRTKLRVET